MIKEHVLVIYSSIPCLNIFEKHENPHFKLINYYNSSITKAVTCLFNELLVFSSLDYYVNEVLNSEDGKRERVSKTFRFSLTGPHLSS